MKHLFLSNAVSPEFSCCCFSLDYSFTVCNDALKAQYIWFSPTDCFLLCYYFYSMLLFFLQDFSLGKYTIKNLSFKAEFEAWRDGLTVKRACCSSRGPESLISITHIGQLTCKFSSRKIWHPVLATTGTGVHVVETKTDPHAHEEKEK